MNPFFLYVILILLLSCKSVESYEKILFTVPQGKGVSYIAEKLKEKNLIFSSTYFKILAIIFLKDKNIKAGVYELDTSMSSYEILIHLAKGKVKMIQFTIPEGWTNLQIAKYFVQQSYINDEEEFLKLTKEGKILKKYNIYGPTTEGFLFPETYTIDPQLKIEKIHEIMLEQFFRSLSRIPESQKISPEELYKKVILASIIQREAIFDDELPLMASVYLNRIKKNMRLQADPTIQYILQNPKKKLTLKDLEIDSPYNTYRKKGLPPTPISNPGLAALKAVFYPAETDYYFFVLKPDGRHYFSKTYEEHLNAKKKYLDNPLR